MTATTTTATRPRRHPGGIVLRQIIASALRVLSGAAAAWDELLAVSQLGPRAEADIGRHTGARI